MIAEKIKLATNLIGATVCFALSFIVITIPSAMAETFSIDGMALNTNSRFPLKDGHPIVSIWSLNPNDNDQQFDRRNGNLVQHRSTGKCLNAYQPSVGSIVNVYPCNANDGDQKFSFISVGNNINLIQRVGTNLCLDMDSRSPNTRMKLWNCNSNFQNQRFVSNAGTTTNNPPPSNSTTPTRNPNDNYLPWEAGYTGRVDQAWGARTSGKVTHQTVPLALDFTVAGERDVRAGNTWRSIVQARAIKGGVVEMAGYKSAYGNTVIIRHDNGTKSQYSHLYNISVGYGQRVAGGQNLGYIGQTDTPGANGQSNVHLHFQMMNASNQLIQFDFKDASGANFWNFGTVVTSQNR